jgi:hypothetical protein
MEGVVWMRCEGFRVGLCQVLKRSGADGIGVEGTGWDGKGKEGFRTCCLVIESWEIFYWNGRDGRGEEWNGMDRTGREGATIDEC